VAAGIGFIGGGAVVNDRGTVVHRRASRGSAKKQPEEYCRTVSADASFDPATLVEWALESLRTSPSTGVALGEEHAMLVANDRARTLLGLGEIPPQGVDWVGMTPPEHRAADDTAISDAKHYGASSWYRKVFVTGNGERREVELLVLSLQVEPFRWLALLRSAGSSPASPSTESSAETVALPTLQLARRLAGAGSVDDVTRIVDRLSTTALDAAHVSLSLLDEDSSTLRIHHDPATAPGVARRYSSLDVSESTMLGACASGDVTKILSLDSYEAQYPGYGSDARKMDLDQLAAVPMHDRHGGLVGVLGIGWRSVGKRDLGHLESVADLIGDAIRLARDSDRNRATAAAFKEMLLPTQLDAADPAVVGVRYHVVDDSVGGDFYDVVGRGTATTWFVIGDVVGHGIGASRTMGKIRFFLRALLLDATDPAEVLERLNDLVLAENQNEVATCLVAVWDQARHTLTFSSAGHLPQMTLTADGAGLLHCPPNPPLGVVRSGPPHPSTSIGVEHGTTIVLFTDGLVEQRDLDIDQALSRLTELVDSFPRADLESLLDRLVDFAAGGVDDDVAILGVEIPAHADHA
jgi:hypothetical protein